MALEFPLWKRLVEIVKAAAAEFGSDKAGRLGAALSYYTIFSLVPLLFLILAVTGFFLDDEQVITDLLVQIEEVAGEAVADTLGPILVTVAEQAGAALTIGLLLAAFSASGIFLQVQGVLNAIFHVPDERVKGIRGMIVQRLVALLSALVLAVFILVPIGSVAAINWAAREAAELGWEWAAPILRLGVPVVALLLLMIVVGITFQVMTRVKIPWKAAWRGGAFTAVIGLAASYGVGWFLSRGSGDQDSAVSTLAVVGGLAVLLFFFNMLWTVYLFGAEVTKVYADYLWYGDIVRPAEREEREREERFAELEAMSPERRRLKEAGVLADTGTFAFLAGLAIGWLGKKR